MNIVYKLKALSPVAEVRARLTHYSVVKRLMDIVLALAALILLAPLMLLTAILIRLESDGPSFFKQTRVGKQGERFLMWKFRSMKTGSEQKKHPITSDADFSDGVRFKMKQDPRITLTGRFIRKFSIDELPQLINVIKGDMSLVGPRPALPEEVELYSPWQRLRLNAKPGITCIWQISGRSTIPFLQQVEMDLDYIRQASFKLDLWILLKTIPAVIFGRGAY